MRLDEARYHNGQGQLALRQSLPCVYATVVGVCFLAAAASGAGASPLEIAAQNPQQRSLATNIVDICPRLSALGGFQLPGDEGDLFRRCNGAITLANTGQTAEAADVLGQIAAEEIIAQESVVNGTIAPQTRAVAARISALSGGAGSVLLANATPGRSDEPILLASTDPWQVVAGNSTMSASHFSGLGVFLTGSYNFGDKDGTNLETGFDFDDYSVTGGVDYSLRDNLVAGIAFGYTLSEIEFDKNAGEIDADGYTIAIYTLLNPTEQLGISGFVSYGMVNYESDRLVSYTDPNGVVNRTASGDADADQFEVTGNVYYDFTSGPWTYGPTARIGYVRTDIDGFTETGAQGLDLVFPNQDADSLQTALGGAVGYALSTSFGVTLLQARGEWVHEFLDDSRTLNLRYENDPFPDSPIITLTSDDPDRDRFLVGGGASFVFEGGISAFADFETQLGHEDVESYTATLGLRMEF